MADLTQMDAKIEDLTLTQQAYATGGSFPIGTGTARFNGNWYEAHAEDSDENEYIVYWTDVNWDCDDEGDACDWDNPDYIRSI